MLQLQQRFEVLYGKHEADRCLRRFDAMRERYGVGEDDSDKPPDWDQSSALLITYGDMVSAKNTPPLRALKTFLDSHLEGAVSTIHILPFFPFSSDDGFSIIDYREVDPHLGSWKDIQAINEHFSLMFDLVLNHVSRKSGWFADYVANVAPARDYFIEMDKKTDLSAVVRPRNTPLLTRTQTRHGERHVWTTFSADQVDLDFSNPDVLFEFLDILLLYIATGARIIRLDAVAYLWKEPGTTCVHLPQTHEVVKIFHDVLQLVAPQVKLLSETNVPHAENISYFGSGDEAHIIYLFTLPPLLLHTLLTGNAALLSRWVAELDPPPAGCTYLNFTASHDGIGVRPLEGLLSTDELNNLLEHIKKQGGLISHKRNPDGSESPYELNISYFSALGNRDDPAPWMQKERFLCSQLIALALKGIPAIYFNSLIAAPNDYAGVDRTQRARSINRQKWTEDQLLHILNEPESIHSQVLWEYSRILHIRAEHPAFHPDGAQRVLDAGPAFFAIERIAPDASETILCISNVTATPQSIIPSTITDSFSRDHGASELLHQQSIDENGTVLLAPYQSCWLQSAKQG